MVKRQQTIECDNTDVCSIVDVDENYSSDSDISLGPDYQEHKNNQPSSSESSQERSKLINSLFGLSGSSESSQERSKLINSLFGISEKSDTNPSYFLFSRPAETSQASQSSVPSNSFFRPQSSTTFQSSQSSQPSQPFQSSQPSQSSQPFQSSANSQSATNARSSRPSELEAGIEELNKFLNYLGPEKKPDIKKPEEKQKPRKEEDDFSNFLDIIFGAFKEEPEQRAKQVQQQFQQQQRKTQQKAQPQAQSRGSLPLMYTLVPDKCVGPHLISKDCKSCSEAVKSFSNKTYSDYEQDLLDKKITLVKIRNNLSELASEMKYSPHKYNYYFQEYKFYVDREKDILNEIEICKSEMKKFLDEEKKKVVDGISELEERLSMLKTSYNKLK